MKTPFTAEQFLEVFKNYNEAVYPMQIIFYIIGAGVLYLAVKPTAQSNKIIAAVLSFFWLWIGIVYHLTFFSGINKAAYLFGAMFILQGIFFLLSGVQNRLSFRYRPRGYGFAGLTLILFALIFYPVLGYLNNHVYPSSPTFGLPCPTTIFTFGLLLLCDKKIPVLVLIIPLVWSVIGFTAAFQFGIVEDTGLLIAGLVSFTMLVMRNKKSESKNIADLPSGK